MSNSTTVSWKGLDQNFKDGLEQLGIRFGAPPEGKPFPDDKLIKTVRNLINKNYKSDMVQHSSDMNPRGKGIPLHPPMILIGTVLSCFHAIQHLAYQYGEAYSEKNRKANDAPWLTRLLFLTLGSYMSVLVGDAAAPFTRRVLGKPGQPNRDHHFGHIFTVFCVGTFLLNVNGNRALSKMGNKIRRSDLYKQYKLDIKKPLSDKEMSESVKLAWLIAAICHDTAYPFEMSRWMRNESGFAEWHTEGLADLLTGISRIDQQFECGLKNLGINGHNNVKDYFSKMQVELKNRESNNKAYLNHGPEMAALVLGYISQDKVLNKIDNWIKFSIFLAIDAIARHSTLADCKFAGLKKEHDKLRDNIKINRENKVIVESLQKTFYKSYKGGKKTLTADVRSSNDKFPLALFLTGVDLLSDANRVHWDVLDYNKQDSKQDNFYRRDVKKEIEKKKLANIPNYVFAKNATDWEIKLLLGAIVGINGITLKSECDAGGKNGKLIIKFTNSFSDNRKKYGYISSDDDTLFDLDESIFELCNIKKEFLKVLVKKMCELDLVYYDYDA